MRKINNNPHFYLIVGILWCLSWLATFIEDACIFKGYQLVILLAAIINFALAIFFRHKYK